MSLVDSIIDPVIEALEGAWKAIKSLFTDTPAGSSSTKCPHAVSPEAAQKAFDELKARDDIPFDYPTDCCYSRAHEMCRTLQEKNVPCGKVWNYAHDFDAGGASLHVPTPNSPSGAVDWRYHVAPTVPVTQPDGSVRDMVMDPSMFDKPVPVEEWVKAQNDPTSIVRKTDSTPYFTTPTGADSMTDPDFSEAHQQLARHRIERDRQKALAAPAGPKSP